MRAAVLLVLTATAAAAQDRPPVPLFAAQDGGVDHVFAGEWEYMVGGGVATFDCSGDGRPELYLAGGLNPATLWRNGSPRGGPLSFSRITDPAAEITAVTGAWPLDVDGDGLTDLAVMRVGENVLLRGLGDCRFERANEVWGFDGGDAWSTAFSATWEGGQDWPTLAVGNYVDRTQDFFPWGTCTDNWLHRPAGRGFAAPQPLTPSFCALSMLFSDWDRGGSPDLRVTNDREYYKGGQEQMWRFAPGEDPRLWTEDEGWAYVRIWGMGIASADITGDGWPEYFLTSMADNKLQVPDPSQGGRPVFRDEAFARGAIAQRPYTGGEVRPSTAWHTQFEDANNDGLWDIFIAKGNVSEMPDFALRDPNNLLLGRPDGRFEESGDRAGVASILAGRGGMVVDLDLDGWLDLIVVNRNGPAEIWRNTGAPGAGAWVQLRLEMPGAANRDAIGAWIEVREGTRILRREIWVGGGHGSGHLGWWHMGLGDMTAPEVRVIWPDGTADDWTPIVPRAFHILRPGAAPEVWAPPG